MLLTFSNLISDNKMAHKSTAILLPKALDERQRIRCASVTGTSTISNCTIIHQNITQCVSQSVQINDKTMYIHYYMLFLLLFSSNMSKIYGSSEPPPYATNGELPVISSTTINPENSQLNKNGWFDVTLLVLKASIMILIIVAAIFGNLLVIVSVMRVRKLR